ncbi:hypothetical protein BV22DRAFT_1125984 [Leucogyrophana mollusca]|uniref:Uncharacterized protein n=1 Tax=Leucogyrophana mollusca TaxID=85980 RepID=A0ACB8BUA9_9AGAM|nr:hypothetical protein BV22DRAFT_1125984 [Leucogyrophana mollusca]
MAPGACENCHSSPKFAGHKYCGKTCASQAAARASAPVKAKMKTVPRRTQAAPAPKSLPLCDYCGQKPKFNNFDYCGKHCAALANAPQPVLPPNAGRSAAKQASVRAPAPKAAVPPTLRSTNAGKSAARTPAAPVPVTQDSSSEEEEEEDEDEDDGTDLDAYPSDSSDEPDPVVAPPPPPATRAPPSKGGQPVPKQASPSRRVPGVCIIPGCGKSSHIDKNGAKTDYCSVRHREEGVNLGLGDACIMCSRYPQSGTDYFCSRICRDQAMNKT